MSKKQVSDSEFGYGCLSSVILGVITLAVLINLYNFKMSFWLVLFSLFIGAFIVQLFFLIWRSNSSSEEQTYIADLPRISQEDFAECTQLTSNFAEFILQTQANNTIMNDIKKVMDLRFLDRHNFGVFNQRIFIMVIHDILKCYNALGIYWGSDILCASLLYYRSETGPYACLDYTTAIIKYDELCNLGDCVIRVIKTLGVRDFDGDTDFMLVGVLQHYGHDTTEYLCLLQDLASYIIKKHGIDSDYIERIMETCQSHDQSREDSRLNIDDLVGLEKVKREVRKLSDFIRVQHLREKEGLKLSSVNYHCVFTGNPGTGKTTVARILADVYKDLGILKKGHLVETDRSGLVAEYVGQTAVKTNSIIDKALDGVLFIDEAYSLIQNGAADYGKEAISTLLKRMEDDRDRLIVILAGYDDEMKAFIDSNPGLRSRFNRYIHFDDYSAEELWQIFSQFLQTHDYVIDDDAAARLRRLFCEIEGRQDKTFGNARFVRNLFEKILENQALRISAEARTDKKSLQRITISDIKDISMVE